MIQNSRPEPANPESMSKIMPLSDKLRQSRRLWRHRSPPVDAFDRSPMLIPLVMRLTDSQIQLANGVFA
ncbi:hypothetical protein ACETRX_36405, partial [Labrys portucalensis]